MNDWPVAFMLVSGVHKPHCKRPHFLLAQQGQPGSLTGRMPDFPGQAGWLVGSTQLAITVSAWQPSQPAVVKCCNGKWRCLCRS